MTLNKFELEKLIEIHIENINFNDLNYFDEKQLSETRKYLLNEVKYTNDKKTYAIINSISIDYNTNEERKVNI